MTTPPSILDISSLPPQTAVTKKYSKLKPPSSTTETPAKVMIPTPTTEAVQTVATSAPTLPPSLPPTSQPTIPPTSSPETRDTAPPTTPPPPQQTTTKSIGKIFLIEIFLVTKLSDTPPKSTEKPFVAGAEPTDGPKVVPQTLFSTKGRRFISFLFL